MYISSGCFFSHWSSSSLPYFRGSDFIFSQFVSCTFSFRNLIVCAFKLLLLLCGRSTPYLLENCNFAGVTSKRNGLGKQSTVEMLENELFAVPVSFQFLDRRQLLDDPSLCMRAAATIPMRTTISNSFMDGKNVSSCVCLFQNESRL